MSSKINKKDALLYHEFPKPGKIAIIPTKKHATQRDLGLAYSPGVAYPCLEIAEEKDKVYKYTSKSNLVAVISNGTAVLGLGDIGPLASKPVMEGKGLLFKIFADIDVFDIEVDTKNIEEFIQTVKNIAPTFGGINLEDIKAPEAFEIERRLVDELDIPVMHDDQHGTAIISTAALKNALEIAGKKAKDVKVVINGAGAAAVSCTKLYKKLGVKPENIVMCDSKGVITTSRKDLTKEKIEFATSRNLSSLEEAMVGSDVFIGLSKGDVVSTDMVKSMAKNPIVFAMANPDPEISYNLAIKSRKDIIMATGRSDHPNQVNNVLGFPFIFRGALDVRASKINEEMKMAAVHALADLAKEPVPEQVNIAYQEKKLHFGKDYIIPKPFDHRLITQIPPAVAKAAMDSGVARMPITDWDKYIESLEDRLGTGNKLMRMITNRAKANPKKVLFAEADELDVLKAAQIVYEEGIAEVVLLGNKKTIHALMKELSFDAEIEIIDPKSKEEEVRRNIFADQHWKKRQRKGLTLLAAQKQMRERNYFAAMMVNNNMADVLVTGYTSTYPSVAKPMIELIGKQEDVQKVSATNIMLTDRGPLFLSDTSMIINPTAEELVEIARLTYKMMKLFGLEPNLAMLSYSNFSASSLDSVRKVQQAVKIMHEKFPDIHIDGGLQADFALNEELRSSKFSFTKIEGKKVNGLIFPNLESANISYKLIKELNHTESVGPIIMGLKKPVHLIQLRASVDEIVNIVCVAVVDAQEKEKTAKSKAGKK